MILVVDDNKDAIAIMEKYLSEYAILTCSSTDAMRILSEGQIDLLITDLAMPIVEGTQLARLAKKLHNIPVIMVTGFSEHSTKLYQNKFIDVILTKPVTKEILLQHILTLLEKKNENKC